MKNKLKLGALMLIMTSATALVTNKWMAAQKAGASPAARQEEAARLRALVTVDAQIQQPIGPACYVVDRLPLDGGLMTYDAVGAEFVGCPAK